MPLYDFDSFFIIGNDIRQSFLADILLQHGHTVYIYDGFEPLLKPPSITSYYPNSTNSSRKTPIPASLKQGCATCKYLVLPTVISPDIYNQLDIARYINNQHFIIAGSLPTQWKNFCLAEKIQLFEYGKQKTFLKQNGILTSEGLLSILISTLPFTLFHCSVLLLGYGNCGKEIASMLQAFHCNITVVENNHTCFHEAIENGLTCISSFHDFLDFSSTPIIINTIPQHLFSFSQIQQLTNYNWIFDIASYPHGFSKEQLHDNGIYYFLESSIPSRFSPMSCSQLIHSIIETHILK